MPHIVLSPSLTTIPSTFEEYSLALTNHHLFKMSFYLRRNQIPPGYFQSFWKPLCGWEWYRKWLLREDQYFKCLRAGVTVSGLLGGFNRGLRVASGKSPCLSSLKCASTNIITSGAEKRPLRASIQLSNISLEPTECGAALEAEHMKLDQTLPRCSKGWPRGVGFQTAPAMEEVSSLGAGGSGARERAEQLWPRESALQKWQQQLTFAESPLGLRDYSKDGGLSATLWGR